MAIEKITVPDLGEASDVEVIELLVTVGQQVAENDSLLVLESDKAAMEIPAPMAGIVKSIAINLGDTVSTGVEILSLEVESNNASAEPDAHVAADETQQAPQFDESSTKAAPTSGKAEQPASIESVVTVPDLGTDDEVDVIEIHVSAGDRLEADQPLLTLESDKAAMEVPSPQAGEVLEILVKVGDKVKTGAEVLKLSADAGGDVVAPAQEAPAASTEASGTAADNSRPMPASEPSQPA
ncbi:MAG: biotin/lipoyl-containing protein, partial [Pseudohongiellaceae bacterium]